MSIDLESTRLNQAGQIIQGTGASVVVNGVVHPIGTVKTRLMATSFQSRWQVITLRGLYNGYLAICGVDALTFSAAYCTNDFFKEKVNSLWGSVLIGIGISPVVAIGEGLMANRQVNALPYSQVFRRALRLNGLIATALREIPFIMAVFSATPRVERYWVSRYNIGEQSIFQRLGIQIAAGASTGAVAGFLTAPFDLIKTRVHTCDQSLSILSAVEEVISKSGWRGLFRGGSARALYIGLAGAGMNIVNHFLPAHLPDALHKEV